MKGNGRFQIVKLTNPPEGTGSMPESDTEGTGVPSERFCKGERRTVYKNPESLGEGRSRILKKRYAGRKKGRGRPYWPLFQREASLFTGPGKKKFRGGSGPKEDTRHRQQ